MKLPFKPDHSEGGWDELTEDRFLAKTSQTILCQQQKGKFLIRRVKIESNCWDEKVDTYTGKIINRRKVPCTCKE